MVINVADGREVGIAASLILKFDSTIDDKAAVEKVLKGHHHTRNRGQLGVAW